DYLRRLYELAILSPERYAQENVQYGQVLLLHPDPSPERGIDAELTRNRYVFLSAAEREAIRKELLPRTKDFPSPL
ncbi:hypothetical protein, partial [Tritonibacter sp. SIMBA_163]|uniref:hypothetical protein n=1 Tax=Tritonibacter sp. SIMBA_163 TaxID=3080868 RepID=UPI00397EA939